MVKPIYNITPFTLLDYPDKTACIFWFAGCNMRCLYCYNPDIVLGKGRISLHAGLHFLQKRQGLLDAVVLSGGECMAHKKISDFLQEIKNKGVLVKIDTNGSFPEKLNECIKNKLVDYVSLDFKATRNKFHTITKSHLFSEFETSLCSLIHAAIPFEVRTTIHADLLQIEDIQEMVNILQRYEYKGTYYLQYYRNNSNTLGNMRNSKNKYIDLLQIQTKIPIVFRNLY
ncbi:MAG: anaerobic ribonucleoside-triphosphate reductase activating protein [Bacteroidetes bacterium]|nr:anaerobic ribonucleoside-triphosphate reductase activating protein [Bacteroidota bacterium]